MWNRRWCLWKYCRNFLLVLLGLRNMNKKIGWALGYLSCWRNHLVFSLFCPIVLCWFMCILDREVKILKDKHMQLRNLIYSKPKNNNILHHCLLHSSSRHEKAHLKFKVELVLKAAWLFYSQRSKQSKIDWILSALKGCEVFPRFIKSVYY